VVIRAHCPARSQRRHVKRVSSRLSSAAPSAIYKVFSCPCRSHELLLLSHARDRRCRATLMMLALTPHLATPACCSTAPNYTTRIECCARVHAERLLLPVCQSSRAFLQHAHCWTRSLAVCVVSKACCCQLPDSAHVRFCVRSFLASATSSAVAFNRNDLSATGVLDQRGS
jgi:hypothetical protein